MGAVPKKAVSMKANETEAKMPQISLQSKSHEELLNIIDDLRSQGISRYIDLPQIIVCGDQSSGKSSVLEAVSGLRFPTKDNLCTRFATELILRRGPTVNATVTIIPDVSRTPEERVKLQAFEAPTTALDDFASIVASAEKAMGLDSARPFSKDILRVELSGPKQPHLTLVDLPGLFHAGNKMQSLNDADSVRALVQSYMEKSRSIILAVVSAKNDYANQIVTKYARDYDPLGWRTLGIITKPDTLHEGSDSEKAFIDLAENKDVLFRLGWHILKNRDYDTRDCSSEERDAAEERFFSKGIWTSLPPSNVGIANLKPRLSRVLKDQILTELPNLIQDVENGVNECRSRLERLGNSRGTPQEQRLYLLKVSQKFSSLMTAAIQGNYADAFFGSSTTADGYSRRLRAVTQNTLLDFTKVIETRGHALHLVEKKSARQAGGKIPREILQDEFIEQVLVLMKRTRGCELPGTFNPLIVGELFYEQSAPWQAIVDKYTQALLEAARTSLNLTLEYAADQATKYGILQNIINPGMEEIRELLEKRVVDLLAHHKRGHPITFNHYLTETLQKKRDDEWKKMVSKKLEGFLGITLSDANSASWSQSINIKSLLEALTQRTQGDMNRFACMEVIHCMDSYYKVAKKFMVDDYGVHCIEEALIQKLPAIFSPETAMALDDAAIENIAAETDESKAERASSTKKLEVLTRTLRILHRLDRHNPKQIDATG